MQISARILNRPGHHEASVATGPVRQTVAVPAKTEAAGSGVNGGELLMLALATCYCNDIYREASRLAIRVDQVEVEATAEFAGIGLAASNISYRARIFSPADAAVIADLLTQTDAVAEVHNTLRSGATVHLKPW
jgi:organic hydroperoxide reductase OsmC/OhrA